MQLRLSRGSSSQKKGWQILLHSLFSEALACAANHDVPLEVTRAASEASWVDLRLHDLADLLGSLQSAWLHVP